MSQTNESSVLFALKELQRLEEDRIADEDRRREEVRLTKRRLEDEEKARLAHDARVAEAEARLRVETDLRAQEADAERRVAALRAEIEAVRADRERLHTRVLSMASESAPVEPPRLGRRIAMGSFGVASIAALVVSLVVAFTPPEVPEARIVEVQVPAPVAPAVEAPAPVVVAPVAEVIEEAAPVVHERPRPGIGSMRQVTAMQSEVSMSDMRLDAIDRCGDDPLCGTELP